MDDRAAKLDRHADALAAASVGRLMELTEQLGDPVVALDALVDEMNATEPGSGDWARPLIVAAIGEIIGEEMRPEIWRPHGGSEN